MTQEAHGKKPGPQIFINNNPFKAPKEEMTGLELKQLGGVYNGVVASLGINEMLRLLLPGFPPPEERTFQVFDGVLGVVRRVAMRAERACGVCEQVRGLGDSAPLPCRRDR